MHRRLGSFAILFGSSCFWTLASRSPRLFAGECLHRAGLHAMAAQRYEVAIRLFEGASGHYRDRLEPERLARVRVHQLMARACAAGGHLSPLSLEVDRALTRLARIESPTPPFAVVPAHVLLANWLEGLEPVEVGEHLAA